VPRSHILSRLGLALAALFANQRPTLVLGLQSRGSLLGALVALHLHIGLVEVRKEPHPSTDSDRWLTTRTPPDYRDRHLQLGVRRDHLDDWIQTGGQALSTRTLVQTAGATWCGAAVIVDGLRDSHLRHDLQVRALLNLRDL
jgi:adenine phosphoribosyltransferase